MGLCFRLFVRRIFFVLSFLFFHLPRAQCIETDFVNLKLMGKFEKRKMTLKKKCVWRSFFIATQSAVDFAPLPQTTCLGLVGLNCI